jgi:hypothetical protein
LILITRKKLPYIGTLTEKNPAFDAGLIHFPMEEETGLLSSNHHASGVSREATHQVIADNAPAVRQLRRYKGSSRFGVS